MSEEQALLELKSKLEKYDSKFKDGKSETLKLLITVATVLLSFIAITSTKGLEAAFLVKIAACSLCFTFIFGFYLFYFTSVSVNKNVLNNLTEAIKNSSNSNDAFARFREFNISVNFAARYGLLVAFLGVAIALIALVARLFLTT